VCKALFPEVLRKHSQFFKKLQVLVSISTKNDIIKRFHKLLDQNIDEELNNKVWSAFGNFEL